MDREDYDWLSRRETGWFYVEVKMKIDTAATFFTLVK